MVFFCETMIHLNIEIKARCADPALIRQYLLSHKAEYRGIDHQVDTYFNVPTGRLKLREGQIENNLIYYERSNQAAARESKFQLVVVPDAVGLKDVLARSIGVRVVVDKHREIYFIKNVKFHIDRVEGLGSFVEIEAGNLYAPLPADELRRQCEFYMMEFGLPAEELVEFSYSDLLLR
jgi:adenylate cyclase, class 2